MPLRTFISEKRLLAHQLENIGSSPDVRAENFEPTAAADQRLQAAANFVRNNPLARLPSIANAAPENAQTLTKNPDGSWNMRVAPGTPVRLSFQGYTNAMVFNPNSLSLGNLSMNDFEITRVSPDQIRIVSKRPFTYEAGALRGSSAEAGVQNPPRRDSPPPRPEAGETPELDTKGPTQNPDGSWDLPVPAGEASFNFAGYSNPMTFEASLTSMGNLTTNGFLVVRQRGNPRRVTVTTREPFRYSSGAMRWSSPSTNPRPEPRRDPPPPRDPEPRRDPPPRRDPEPRRDPPPRRDPEPRRDPPPRPRPRSLPEQGDPPPGVPPPERRDSETPQELSDAQFTSLVFGTALPNGSFGPARVDSISDRTVKVLYAGRETAINLKECKSTQEVQQKLHTSVQEFVGTVTTESQEKVQSLQSRVTTLRTLAQRPTVPDTEVALTELRNACNEVNVAYQELRQVVPSAPFTWQSQMVPFARSYEVRIRPGTNTVEVFQDSTVITPSRDFNDANRRRVRSADSFTDADHGKMDGDAQKHLQAIGRVASGNYVFEEKDGKFIISVKTRAGTEQWQLRSTGMRYNDYPTSTIVTKLDATGKPMPNGSIVTDEILSATRTDGKVTGLSLKTGWTQEIDRCRESISVIQESESQDAADMRNFDIPRDRPVGVFQLDGVATADNALKPSGPESFRQFTEMMSDRGHRMIRPQSGLTLTVNKSPTDIIRATLQEFHTRGISDVYLNLNAHGSDAFYFPSSADADGKPDWSNPYRLTHADLMQEFRRYPNMRVTINTVACYGAWQNTSGSALRDVPNAPEGRITTITQTTPDVYNVSHNAYDTLLYRYLAEKNPNGSPRYTYGQAHLLADRDTQVGTGFNPRVRRSSTNARGYNETARNDNVRRSPFETERGQTA